MADTRITDRAEGALRKLGALKWAYRLHGASATTIEKAIEVIESQRDEILALNAYLDTIEPEKSIETTN